MISYYTIPVIKKLLEIANIDSNKGHNIDVLANALLSNYYPLSRYFIDHKPMLHIRTPGLNPYIAAKEIVSGEIFTKAIVWATTPLNIANISILLQIEYDVIALIGQQMPDLNGVFQSCIIIIRGLKIAFYSYHIFRNTATIRNVVTGHDDVYYQGGALPLNYAVSETQYKKWCPTSTTDDYNKYLDIFPDWMKSRQYLLDNGVESELPFEYPHVFDLMRHKEFVHELFKFAQKRRDYFGALDYSLD